MFTFFRKNGYYPFYLLSCIVILGGFQSCKLLCKLGINSACTLEQRQLKEAVEKDEVGKPILPDTAKKFKSYFDNLRENPLVEKTFPNFIEFKLDESFKRFISDTAKGGKYLRISNALTKNGTATVVLTKIDINTNPIAYYSRAIDSITDKNRLPAIELYYNNIVKSQSIIGSQKTFIVSEIFRISSIYNYLLEMSRNDEIRTLRIYYGLKENNQLCFILTRSGTQGEDGLTFLLSDMLLRRQNGGANDLFNLEPKNEEYGCCEQTEVTE